MYEFDPELAAEISGIPLEPATRDLLGQEARDIQDHAAAIYAAIGVAESIRYRGVRLEFEYFNELKVKGNTLLKPFDSIELQLGHPDSSGHYHTSRKLDLLVDDMAEATFLVAHDSEIDTVQGIENRVVQLASYSGEFSEQFRPPPIERHIIRPFAKVAVDTTGGNFHGHEDDRLWLPDEIIGITIGSLALMKSPRVQ